MMISTSTLTMIVTAALFGGVVYFVAGTLLMILVDSKFDECVSRHLDESYARGFVALVFWPVVLVLCLVLHLRRTRQDGHEPYL